jgi:hypothetical protein
MPSSSRVRLPLSTGHHRFLACTVVPTVNTKRLSITGESVDNHRDGCNHADAIRRDRHVRSADELFGLLYGLVILRQSRRELLWLGVTAHPNAEWLARQLTEACGWDEPPSYLIRDRASAYGAAFIRRIRAMGIRGSIRRECLDHVVVVGERHLRHVLASYQKYYNEVRTHLSLRRDVCRTGRVRSSRILGGLHHQYVRV